MAKAKQIVFVAMAVVTKNVTVEVPADTLEEALEIARGYSVDDVLNKPGDLTDEEVRITGVYE